jgi:hypothetical protein
MVKLIYNILYYKMNVFEERDAQSKYYDLLTKLQFGTVRPIMIGSAGLASQLYVGDIDLVTFVLGRKENKFVNREIKDIVRNIQTDDDLYFMEFKIQYTNGKKIKFYPDEVDKIEIPTKNFDDIEYLKIDLIYYIDSRFREVSINYWFKEIKDIIGRMKEDIEELRDEGRYYKVIKRLFSIAKQLNDIPKGLILSKFLNKAVGHDYMYLNNLKAIRDVLMVYDDNKTRDKARINLKNMDIMANYDHVEKLINKYQEKVDNSALKFLKTIE